jgi:regulator of protease activity HflC (stomatin/prohibitin superfamily)
MSGEWCIPWAGFRTFWVPGWHVVWPIFQKLTKVDVRTKAVDVPKQDIITKDNVSAKMSAVIYYKIVDAGKAVNEVENVFWAVSQLAQTTMRRITGEVTLDELLSNREKLLFKFCKLWRVPPPIGELMSNR